ncbi:prolyl-tRNA synthetase associated domain-containing protein [Paracoccaceae bacterium]|jgi:Ala-tRNA(Pro) deacylase|nr:prolyl-tRNA synthetase associated domain-containing protein [Paracoccaceae bacterium]
MNDTVDASSKYQYSLPISSDAIMERLDNWGITYKRADHVPLRTVEESKKVQGQFLSSEQGGGHIKNLYFRDNKKRNVLLVAEQDRQIDLKTLNTKLGTGRLSFGSAERLMENLGVRPGAVTPLSMINGVETGVQLKDILERATTLTKLSQSELIRNACLRQYGPMLQTASVPKRG